MGRLQTSIGLVTGTDINGTVDQLIKISARPRDRLVARTADLQKQQTAIAELTALVIGVEFAGDKLKVPTQYQGRKGTSSNEAAISVSASANAEVGSLKARAVQVAATHSAQSRGLTSTPNTALGFTGEIVIRTAGTANPSVSLDALNQGLGVQRGAIRITDRSGNTQDIDLSKAQTIDDVLDAINNASDVRVRATTVGDSIKLTDTSGAITGFLRVDEVGSGETAADLGLRGINLNAASATGTDIYGDITDTQPTGLQGVSLSKLSGGNGLGTLTSINIKITDGTTQNVDLSSATTTQDIVRLINDSGLNIEARLNESGTGFKIRDLSGGSANAFQISSSDTTATKLGLAKTSTSRIIEGSDLNRQVIDLQTKLSDLRQGRGIDAGTFLIRNSSSQLFGVDVSDAANLTVGDLIDAINANNISVTASINATGDGIAIVDSSNGAGKFSISDTAGDKTAEELGLKIESTKTTTGNTSSQKIDARQADVIAVNATDKIQDIVSRINESGRFGTASIATGPDGSQSIAFKSARGGEAGRISITSTGFDIGARTTAVGNDAIVEVELESGSKQRLRSIDGVFNDVAPGISLTAKEVSSEEININVTRDSATAVTNLKAFVAQYNKLVEKLDSLTFFSQDSNEVGLLFGSNEALRIETAYSRLLSGSIIGAGAIRGIGELGLSFTDSGKLELDETKLTAKLTSNSDAVSEFLTKDSTGLVARLKGVATRIAGPENSLLISRTEALGTRVLRNNRQADEMQTRLNKERDRLLARYQAAELAISKLQSNQNAISRISFIGDQSRN